MDDEDLFAAIHNVDTFYRLDMRKDFVLISYPMQYYVDYEVKISMPRTNKTCKDRNFDEECVYDKFDDSIPKLTPTFCTVPWSKNKSNVCNKDEDARIALGMAQKIADVEIQNCENVCTSMPMFFTGGSAHSDLGPRPSITFNFQPVIRVNTEKYLYTFLNLFAEVGGYVGMMVGYSFMTFAEYFHYNCR